MDLKQYFKKIQDSELTITDDYPLIASLETSDGGRAGIVVEVSKREAAKAIVENRAVLANEEQRKAYRQREAQLKKAAEKADLARRLQFAIISDSELKAQKSVLRRDESKEGSR